MELYDNNTQYLINVLHCTTQEALALQASGIPYREIINEYLFFDIEPSLDAIYQTHAYNMEHEELEGR